MIVDNVEVKLLISPSVFYDITQIVSLTDIDEIAWWHTVKVTSHYEKSKDGIQKIKVYTFTLTGTYMTLQEAGPVNVIQKEEGELELLDLEEKGVFDGELNCWGHSHVTMAVTPSATDDENLDKYIEDGNKYFIRLITNKKGNFHNTIYLDTEEMGRWYFIDVPIEVDWSTFKSDTDWKKEIEKKVVKKKYENHYGRYGTYNGTYQKINGSYYYCALWELQRVKDLRLQGFSDADIVSKLHLAESIIGKDYNEQQNFEKDNEIDGNDDIKVETKDIKAVSGNKKKASSKYSRKKK